jgi:hypothetical protein
MVVDFQDGVPRFVFWLQAGQEAFARTRIADARLPILCERVAYFTRNLTLMGYSLN